MRRSERKRREPPKRLECSRRFQTVPFYFTKIAPNSAAFVYPDDLSKRFWQETAEAMYRFIFRRQAEKTARYMCCDNGSIRCIAVLFRFLPGAFYGGVQAIHRLHAGAVPEFGNRFAIAT